ncbi:hypothetical protein Trco_003446 [Trichoderma cornu-damae]|uniref:Uncharacterized protein n=1 Tax=Trichoderma cornu-damae TaxID=654480 RepID=A0A9P8TW65_9HYPO|nr:hypothetical protein Trco_003446 [Trichoderma cornu-damae]
MAKSQAAAEGPASMGGLGGITASWMAATPRFGKGSEWESRLHHAAPYAVALLCVPCHVLS